MAINSYEQDYFKIGYNDEFLTNSFAEIINISQLDNCTKKLLIITDLQIWKNCGDFFQPFIKKYNIKLIILDNPDCSDKQVNELILKIKDDCFLIALGSGTINDLCKYIAFNKKIKFVTFASAASMNGYLSQNCSIKICNFKTTINAVSPVKVFCDLRILKTAPVAMLKAGIGDLMCFYSCYFDWYLAHKLFNYDFNKESIRILEDEMKQFIDNFKNFSLDDDELYFNVIKILLISGIAMTIAGGSYPASQSEHLIAHTITMKYPQFDKDCFHGQMIAVTTFTSAKMQEELLDNFSNYYRSLLNLKIQNLDNLLNSFFGKDIAINCLEQYQQKLDKIKSTNIKSENELAKIRLELSEILFKKNDLVKIFDHFAIDYKPQSFGLHEKLYQEAILNAKFIRNRLTCLDFFDKLP